MSGKARNAATNLKESGIPLQEAHSFESNSQPLFCLKSQPGHNGGSWRHPQRLGHAAHFAMAQGQEL